MTAASQTRPTKTGGFLERRFRLSERETTARTEVLGGVATFLTMSYILFVNPAILSAAGMPFHAVAVATAIAACVTTLAMGLFTNLPFALVVRAGNDGSFARAAVERIARGYGFHAVAEPILSVGEDLAGPLARCEELGQLVVAGLELGIFGRSA